MKPPTSRLRIGFLPFYVNYYEGICPGFPAEKAEVATRCHDRLSEHGEVLWDGALIQDVAAADAAGKSLAEKAPDCVVVVTTIAVFGAIGWAALQRIDRPILIWNPQLIETVGPGYSMEEIVRNTSQIGTQALANTLLRHGRNFRVVTGYENSAHVADALARHFGVIRAVKALRSARLLAVGEVFDGMTDILIDEEDLARRVGAQVVHVSTGELTRRYREVPEDRVREGLDEMKRRFAIAHLTDGEAARSTRLCAAVSGLVEEHEADGGTLNCHAHVCLRNPDIGITACYSHGLQNASGRPFTCTGDLPTALAMLLLKALSGMAMYTEVQVMDEIRDAVVIANSGEGEDAVRRRGCPALVRGNTNFQGLHGRGASFAYALEPGPATILSLTPTRTNYRLIAAEGVILDETLPDTGALAGFFRFSHVDLRIGYTRWLEAGAVHHAATTLGHRSREIAAVAEHLGFEMIAI